jgi:hypothetical protein
MMDNSGYDSQIEHAEIDKADIKHFKHCWPVLSL